MNGPGHDNAAFVGDSVYTIPCESRRNITQFYPGAIVRSTNYPPPAQFQVTEKKYNDTKIEENKQRDSWGKGKSRMPVLCCIYQ